jgi:hypothetical protein
MTLQYARLFQLRAGISLIAEHGGMTQDELAEALRQRKSIKAPDEAEEKVQGADDIIAHLQEAHLIKDTSDGYRLTTQDDLETTVGNTVLLYAGEAIPGAGDERTEADRILTNVMYEHPMLVVLTKYVYRYGPVQKYEVKREFDGEAFLDDKMNSFTIDMGLDLLDDAGVIEAGDTGFTRGRWPVRVFAHVVHEEYFDLGGDSGGGVREPDLFERLETLYGIKRSTFDTLLSRLHAEGIVSEASYEELILNANVLTGANIHE